MGQQTAAEGSWLAFGAGLRHFARMDDHLDYWPDKRCVPRVTLPDAPRVPNSACYWPISAHQKEGSALIRSGIDATHTSVCSAISNA
jgi:hypothetical protein